MRFVGSVLLALLGVGIFPFNTRVLSTAPGLVLALVSAALLFFAYRAATHGRKRAQAPEDAGADPCKPSAGQPGAAAAESDFVILPTMPDITKSKPRSGYMVGERMLMFFENPDSIAKTQGGVDLPLKHRFAASVFNGVTKRMERLFTLETGFTSEVFFCAFERSGSHTNLGDGALLSNLRTFEAAVVNSVCTQHGVHSDAARAISL